MNERLALTPRAIPTKLAGRMIAVVVILLLLAIVVSLDSDSGGGGDSQ